MAVVRHIVRSVVLTGALLLGIAAVSPSRAQTLPNLPEVVTSAAGVVVVVPVPPVTSVAPIPGSPGAHATQGRAQIDYERERTRDRGRVVAP
jgi:hypothetical protein